MTPRAHTPPGTSDEHLTVVKTLANARPEGAVIVTTPQEVALATIRKEINFCRKMKVKVIGLVENMSGYQCPCCEVGLRTVEPLNNGHTWDLAFLSFVERLSSLGGVCVCSTLVCPLLGGLWLRVSFIGGSTIL